MKRHNTLFLIPLLMGLLLIAGPPAALGEVFVQCPEDTDGDGDLSNNADIPKVSCQHLTGGDGWVSMADGTGNCTFSASRTSATYRRARC